MARIVKKTREVFYSPTANRHYFTRMGAIRREAGALIQRKYPAEGAEPDVGFRGWHWTEDDRLIRLHARLVRMLTRAGAQTKAEHVWGGGYEVITEGAYFARLLAQADHEGRIGDFPHDPDRKVFTAWDIGVDDYTAIWFLQEDGRSVRAIGYYETSGEGPDTILDDAVFCKPYDYETHYFPHDVKVREWGAGAKSRLDSLRELGLSGVRVGVQQDPADRINAARRLLPVTSFDRKGCELGLRRLRNYRRRWSEPMQTFLGPLHDDNCHGADAFGEFAVNCAIVPKPAPKMDGGKPQDYTPAYSGGGDSWTL